jgi:hypothetical protein
MKEHLIVNFNFNKERRGPILLAFSMQVINAAVVYLAGDSLSRLQTRMEMSGSDRRTTYYAALFNYRRNYL